MPTTVPFGKSWPCSTSPFSREKWIVSRADTRVLAGGVLQVEDMPTRSDGKGSRIDGRALIYLLRSMVGADQAAIVVFEDVRPRPMGNAGAHGNTMHSQGSMMRSRGIMVPTVTSTGATRSGPLYSARMYVSPLSELVL